MSEVLFILTTMFVAYVIYTVTNDQSANGKPKNVEIKPIVDQENETKIAEQNLADNAGNKSKNETLSSEDKRIGLKNPKTGEIATAYNNYRFTKRWIKEALVEEGLLDKVYTGNELNQEIEFKIKQAITALEAIDKYKP